MNDTYEMTCGTCNKVFKTEKAWGRYCSRKCGDVARMRAYRERKAQQQPKDTPPQQS